jgi:hypothetical protein
VTDVRVVPNLKSAKVYVTVPGNEADHKAALKALSHAAPYVRKQIGLSLNIPHIPELHFVRDRVEEEGERVDQLLAKIPSQVLEAPKLRAEPTEVSLGVIPFGTNRSFELHLANLGMRLLYGSVSSDCKWLTLGEAPGNPQRPFQFGGDSVVQVQIRGILPANMIVKNKAGQEVVVRRPRGVARKAVGKAKRVVRRPRKIAKKGVRRKEPPSKKAARRTKRIVRRAHPKVTEKVIAPKVATPQKPVVAPETPSIASVLADRVAVAW